MEFTRYSSLSGSNVAFVPGRLTTRQAGCVACRRIDLAAGVVPARPRGGFRLSLRDVEQRPRVLGDNEQQRARGARRRTPFPFLVLQRLARGWFTRKLDFDPWR